jgi:hypothetical protein
MSVTLTYSGNSVVLPNPTWGDQRKIHLRTRFKEDMLGYTHGIVRNQHYYSLTFAFNTLRRSKSLELLDWLELYAGYVVSVTDHFGNSWSGNIMNSNPTIAVIKRGIGATATKETCSITLQFTGNSV